MRHPSRGTHDCIRVLVADSNQTQSGLLSPALRRQPGIKVTRCRGELSDCAEAVSSAPRDIVVLSGSPSDPSQLLNTLGGLHSSHPHIGFVLLLDSYDRHLVVNAMRAGVQELFWRACHPFRTATPMYFGSPPRSIRGKRGASGLRDRRAELFCSPGVMNTKEEGPLTLREEQVVKLLAEGIGNREIGQSLGFKENSVRKAEQRIYDKLGVSIESKSLCMSSLFEGRGEQSPFPEPGEHWSPCR